MSHVSKQKPNGRSGRLYLLSLVGLLLCVATSGYADRGAKPTALSTPQVVRDTSQAKSNASHARGASQFAQW